MRSTLVRFLMVSLLASALAQTVHAADEKAVPAVPAVDPVTLIVDLRENVSGIFSYATWQNKLMVSASGITLLSASGAQGDGGMGRNIDPVMDLSETAFVEVALAAGGHNEVPEMTVALNDADGTQVAARLRVDQLMPSQPVWLRVRRENFVRVSGQDGRDGKMDWTKVAQWHLQGDWTTKKPLHVVFIALRVRK